MTGIGAVGTPASQAPDHDAALREAARQLEGVFVKLMFEEMAKTVSDAGLFPKAPGSDMYQQWFRGAVAEQWAAAGGTGLGDRIAASLGAEGEQAGLGELRSALRAASGKVGALDRADARGPGEAAPKTVQLPVPGVISSGFGARAHPVLGHADDHRGVDIAVPVGTPVRAPYAGRVHEVGETPALGRYVIVEHEGGYRSVFGHLSETPIEAGAPVRAGDVVAKSGNTGRSTGPHLHYGLYRNGRAVDPTPHLR